jgi:hypothetical protein
MLVEVDAYLRLGLLSVDAAAPAPMGVLGARGSPILLGPNEPRVDTDDYGALGVGNVVTSVSGLGPEVAMQPMAEDLEKLRCDEENVEQAALSTVVLVAKDVAQVATPSAQPAAAVATVGSPAVPAESLESFIASLKLPLEESLIALPRSGVYRVLTTPCSSRGTVTG